MPPKRRLSSAGEHTALPISKRTRTQDPLDHLSDLSDELLIRILHNLPIFSLLQCQRLSHRFYSLAGDPQIWKNLYYNRFVLPRALRIPGMRTAPDEALHFSSRRSKWLHDNTLLNRAEGKETNWKRQYKLRYNWSVGACEVQEIHVADRPSVPSMLVRLAEGVVITADKEDGLRAWDLKEKELIATCSLEDEGIPTCLAVDEQESKTGGLGIALGFMDGGWGTWRLDIPGKAFRRTYRYPASSNGLLSAVAYSNPYVLTITEGQLLSLYSFTEAPPTEEDESSALATPAAATDEDEDLPLETTSAPTDDSTFQQQTLPTSPLEQPPYPRLLASLKSHTSWPPLSLSIRTTTSTIIASIAYSLPTYLSGYTIGLQELHLSPVTGLISSSRLTSALPPGFSSLLSPSTSSPSSGTSTPIPFTSQLPSFNEQGRGSRPTTLSYSHPYILATHPDNTLTLYLCTSTASSLTITPGTKLWGHTSSVSSAEITPRGKAVSVSTRGNELRVWELEGGLSSATTSSSTSSKFLDKKRRKLEDRSVRIRPEPRSRTSLGEDGIDGEREMEGERYEEVIEERKRWVGFDDEMVIVLKESGRGTQALMVYDFT
jgi:F-box domain